ncbi:MAG: GNAT family N-acetyltransferase [Myxococcota bacterium]
MEHPAKEPRSWRLRRATTRDVDALHALFSLPDVYRYLADGVAPARAVSEAWVAGNSTPRHGGLGLWLLVGDGWPVAGCVRLEERSSADSLELTYVLHPALWGRGLATRMGWSAICRAFGTGAVSEVVAGADAPNRASLAVMRRLGMELLGAVDYPAGRGFEYVLRRDAGGPTPRPEPIGFEDE